MLKKSFPIVPLLQVAAVAGLALAGVAHAELPTEVTTSVNGYKVDATTAIGLIMGAGVTIWGLLKLASKLGWR